MRRYAAQRVTWYLVVAVMFLSTGTLVLGATSVMGGLLERSTPSGIVIGIGTILSGLLGLLMTATLWMYRMARVNLHRDATLERMVAPTQVLTEMATREELTDHDLVLLSAAVDQLKRFAMDLDKREGAAWVAGPLFRYTLYLFGQRAKLAELQGQGEKLVLTLRELRRTLEQVEFAFKGREAEPQPPTPSAPSDPLRQL